MPKVRIEREEKEAEGGCDTARCDHYPKRMSHMSHYTLHQGHGRGGEADVSCVAFFYCLIIIWRGEGEFCIGGKSVLHGVVHFGRLAGAVGRRQTAMSTHLSGIPSIFFSFFLSVFSFVCIL